MRFLFARGQRRPRPASAASVFDGCTVGQLRPDSPSKHKGCCKLARIGIWIILVSPKWNSPWPLPRRVRTGIAVAKGRMNRQDLKTLRLFVITCELKSLTKAAQRLNLAPSAASRRIRLLEEG